MIFEVRDVFTDLGLHSPDGGVPRVEEFATLRGIHFTQPWKIIPRVEEFATLRGIHFTQPW